MPRTSNRVFVVGVGMTKFEKPGRREGWDYPDMARESGTKALEDAGISYDEAAFEEFRKSLTWEGHAQKIRVPYLCLTGEFDELSPLKHTEALMRAVRGKKRLVVYQESRHSVGNVPAANLGPFPGTLVADWMAATLNGKTFQSEKWVVQPNGTIVKTPFKS